MDVRLTEWHSDAQGVVALKKRFSSNPSDRLLWAIAAADYEHIDAETDVFDSKSAGATDIQRFAPFSSQRPRGRWRAERPRLNPVETQLRHSKRLLMVDRGANNRDIARSLDT
jgi:hypothetical protein